MLRKAAEYEQTIFEIIKEYNLEFYYCDILRLVNFEKFKIEITKKKKEMTGKAVVTFSSGEVIEYKIRYNRIVNLTEDYTLVVPGIKVG